MAAGWDRAKAWGVLVALLAAIWVFAAPAQARELPLSPADEARYRTAFDAAERGDFKAAEAALAGVKDRSLVGHVRFIKLMHPTAYTASYDDLAAWLEEYAELGGAERIHALALKRRPASARLPKSPPFLAASRQWTQGEQAASGDAGFRARDAYYSGEVEKAYILAPAAGEPWVAGLAAWRLGKLVEARRFFLMVAEDDTNDDWVRTGGWFWAGRTAERLGEYDEARRYFLNAAAVPHTFYGLLATRKLELDAAKPRVIQAGAPVRPAPPSPEPERLVRTSSGPEARRADNLIERDPRARRAAALVQVGRQAEAAAELRVGLALATSATAEREWQGLIETLRTPLQLASAPMTAGKPRTKARPSRPEVYEAPELYPEGGFTLNRALVYAVVRQESRFNPYAYSSAGAVGLMQVLPESAARAAGDDHLTINIMPLFDPPVNLRIGQDYITWLIERGLGGGEESWDLFQIIGAYNAGPGAVLKTRRRMEPGADALLIMESLPAGQTRVYVERVSFGYWTYLRMFGQPTPTLDAAVRYERIIDIRLDR
jgi:soluble lytic murein transglycosylase-like protein